MRNNRISWILVCLFLSTGLFAQSKKYLDRTVYDDWKSVNYSSISYDGNWISYTIDPQEGDGLLILYNVQEKSRISIPRGYKPILSSNSNMLVFHIKPQFDTLRKAKLNKVKKDKLPKDSIGIIVNSNGEVKKYADLISVVVPKDNSDWMAFTLKMPKKKNDTTSSDTTSDNTNLKKENKKKKKGKGDLLVLINPITGDSISFANVTKYSMSKNGKMCSFIRVLGDSIDSVQVSCFNTQTLKVSLIFSGRGYSENIVLDNKGQQVSFTFSTDTIKEKSFGLYYSVIAKKRLVPVVDSTFSSLPTGWSVSKNSKLYFNDEGSELYFGTALKPQPKTKDTLTDDEKVSVDIWNWKDIKLQPQQLKELAIEKKRSYTAVYFPPEDKVIQIGYIKIETVSINKKSKGELSLGYDYKPYQRMSSWEASRYKDVYLINRNTGNRQLILSKVASSISLSPNQEFVLWYNIADSSWNSYDIKDKVTINLTSKLGINFYNEINDIPNEAGPYGFCGWTEKGFPVVYDEFDLWQLDARGKANPTNLTSGYGRNNKIKLRYIKLDKDIQYLPNEILLSAFNKVNKDHGFYSLNIKSDKNPMELIMDGFDFRTIKKAKNSDNIIWTKQSFNVFPDLYVSSTSFTGIKRLTHANPQQDEYNWGNVELVNWISFNGDSIQGMLYTPENLDPKKKYPVLVYFYERYSDRLHSYHVPKPIRSVINFSYYVSNEYVIFVPDIVYRDGYPGPSAYDCIISGTQSICDNYDFIDRERMGIQGQSWGGYQVAYLITQTNIYKAAMAGAPVSNMTSAYGGIRWGSGLSRAFQYEQTQSRIGGNLWDKLPLHMLNSPLFSVDRVETPLLIMHNDKDGAVPWYQGIELFNALRRLDKPVWMLVYNGAPHNLKRRADCKDLTIRMQQFFDYYLKDAPEPVWMKTGVPALKKGKSFGFETD